MGKLFRLFIPRKSSDKVPDLDTNWRAIERWAQNVGGITEITSQDGSVTIVDPFGPVTDLSAAGSGGGRYKSLTGDGATATPGDLAQAGGLTVTVQTTSTEGFQVVNNSTHQGITLTNAAANAGVQITDTKSSGLALLEEGGTLGVSCFNGAGTIQNCSIGMGPVTPTSLSDLRLRTPSHTTDSAKTDPSGMEIRLGSLSPVRLFTGFLGTGGQPSYADPIRAFSFGSDGHIYTSTGSGWSLVA